MSFSLMVADQIQRRSTQKIPCVLCAFFVYFTRIFYLFYCARELNIFDVSVVVKKNAEVFTTKVTEVLHKVHEENTSLTYQYK